MISTETLVIEAIVYATKEVYGLELSKNDVRVMVKDPSKAKDSPYDYTSPFAMKYAKQLGISPWEMVSSLVPKINEFIERSGRGEHLKCSAGKRPFYDE